MQEVNARNGNITIIELLLKKGAAVDARNKVGGTALMWAVSYGHGDATRGLLEHGADRLSKDEDGITASGWAEKNKRKNVVALLASAVVTSRQ